MRELEERGRHHAVKSLNRRAGVNAAALDRMQPDEVIGVFGQYAHQLTLRPQRIIVRLQLVACEHERGRSTSRRGAHGPDEEYCQNERDEPRELSGLDRQ